MATQEAKIYIQENEIVRELKGDELKAYLIQAEADKIEYEKFALEKEKIKAKKMEILERLNITESEAALLLS